MRQSDFERFYRLVLQDAGLQEKLRTVSERDHFINQVVALGEQHGFHFTDEEVRVVMAAKRRAWVERWSR